MTQDQIIHAFVKLGESCERVASGHPQSLWEQNFFEVTKKEHIYNGWFTPNSVLQSLQGITSWLEFDSLKKWANPYTFAEKPKRIGIVMAGNIPLVGFHDFLAVLISGNCAVVKLSKDDNRMFPLIVEYLIDVNPELKNRVVLTHQLKDFDAVIATGSNNSALYFEQYFSHVPHIIRRNRTSVAVLNGNESSEDLALLGDDIFTFFGLGCRNVSKLFIPENFDLNRFFGAIVKFGDVIHHHKYANNYDYYRTIYLMNLEPILENGFLLVKETKELHSPLAVLYYERYSDREVLQHQLQLEREKIQVIVGDGYEAFGKAQQPELTDYADSINTLEFLAGLTK